MCVFNICHGFRREDAGIQFPLIGDREHHKAWWVLQDSLLLVIQFKAVIIVDMQVSFKLRLGGSVCDLTREGPVYLDGIVSET